MPPLSQDELRVLRQMMSEYQQNQIVGQWLSLKWRRVAFVGGLVSAATVFAAAVLGIVKAFG